MSFEINYKSEGMVIDFRSKNANTNLQRIFVEVKNEGTWIHLCFFILWLKSKKVSFTDVLRG